MNENKYYFNDSLNYCATEEWVADYLYVSGMVDSRDEAVSELRSCRNFFGWFSCELQQ